MVDRTHALPITQKAIALDISRSGIYNTPVPLVARMGIAAVAPQPGTSKRHRAHPVYPYLLRHQMITRPNHVWAMDITDFPMARGFVFSPP